MNQLIANRYEVLEQLGAGGMGAVYLVEDKLRNQQVALKQVLMADDFQRLAITREFRTLSSLRHPNIVGVIEYGFHEKQPYFTMDYLPNATPFETVSAEKIQGFIQILQALSYLHRRGILHHDLKPANVLVTPEGVVKVLDFGLARDNIKGKSGTKSGIAGTLGYMSPELLNEEAATIGSDLWAVGVMLCDALTGHHPFDDSSPMQLVLSLVNKSPNLEGIDEAFIKILERLLAKDPQDRYPHAQAVIQDLYLAIDAPMPSESSAQRESFLQSASFVGRESEYQTLVDALQTSRDKQGQLWLIGAEAGAGKSRLLEELRTRALVDGFVVLQGQGVEGGGLPYQLWRELARKLVLGAPLPDFTARVLKDLVPDIASLLGREVVDLPPADMKTHRERLSLALLERLHSLDMPILILLEDLHWASESLELLKLLLRAFESIAVLVVGSYRHDERPDLPSELPKSHMLKLERLSHSAIAQLSASMLGAEHSTPELVERLAQESEGNALFMVEVVRALAEEAGSLSQISKQTLPASIFAGGMLAVLQRRLAKVPDWALKALQFSAVIGRKIDLNLLTELGISELGAWLQTCADAFVLEPYQGEWRFSHDRLREGVLKEVPELAQLHTQVASAIETVYPNNKAYDEPLIEHWHIAGNAEKEVFYLLKVARQLIDFDTNYLRAEALLQRALRYQLASSLSEIFFRLGTIAYHRGHYNQAEIFWQKGLDSQPPPPLQIFLIGRLGHLLASHRGNYTKATELIEQSIAIAEKYGHKAFRALSLCFRILYARDTGDLLQAHTAGELALALAREQGEAWAIVWALGFFGNLLAYMGDYAQAHQLLEEGLVMRRELGVGWGTAVILTYLADLAYFEGNYDRSQSLYLESLPVFQRIENKDSIVYALAGLTITCVSLGDYQLLRDYLIESLVVVIETASVAMMFITLLAAAYWTADLERAAAWAGLLQAKASGEVTLDPRFKQLLTLLEAKMGETAFNAALEAGKTLDVNTEVQNLFKELTES